MSPCKKVEKLLERENVSPVIPERFIFGEILHSQLKENFEALGNNYKSKRRFYNAVSGKILKKYKRFYYNKSFLGSKRFFQPYKTISRINDNQLRYGKITKKIINDIHEFFERDDVSRMCPGKKDCISRNKVKKQKRVLNDTLQNLYKSFSHSVNYKISY